MLKRKLGRRVEAGPSGNAQKRNAAGCVPQYCGTHHPKMNKNEREIMDAQNAKDFNAKKAIVRIQDIYSTEILNVDVIQTKLLNEIILPIRIVVNAKRLMKFIN